MVDRKQGQPRNMAGLSREIQDFVRRRAKEQELKASEPKKKLKIQLLISELEILLLNMSNSDPNVVSAKSKLLELKTLIAETSGTK